jgi:hypothetical protein
MAEYTNIVFGDEDKTINFYDDEEEKPQPPQLLPPPKESFCTWLLRVICSTPA